MIQKNRITIRILATAIMFWMALGTAQATSITIDYSIAEFYDHSSTDAGIFTYPVPSAGGQYLGTTLGGNDFSKHIRVEPFDTSLGALTATDFSWTLSRQLTFWLGVWDAESGCTFCESNVKAFASFKYQRTLVLNDIGNGGNEKMMQFELDHDLSINGTLADPCRRPVPDHEDSSSGLIDVAEHILTDLGNNLIESLEIIGITSCTSRLELTSYGAPFKLTVNNNLGFSTDELLELGLTGFDATFLEYIPLMSLTCPDDDDGCTAAISTLGGSSSISVRYEYDPFVPDVVPLVVNPEPPVGVPEPSTLTLFGLGILGLGFARRSKLRQS